MRVIFPQREAIPEGQTKIITMVLLDENGVAVASGAITSIVATLKEVASDTIINSRNAQDVNGVNGGTYGAGGLFTLKLSHLDNIIVTVSGADLGRYQLHRLLVEAGYNSSGVPSTGQAKQEIDFYVEDLAWVS